MPGFVFCTLGNYQIIISLIAAVILVYWRPYVLIEGVQRSCLYAAIALPMALTMGVVGIINLAHGDFMMLGAYFAYWINIYAGVDPLLAMVPALFVFFLLGVISYKVTIKHVLHVPLLNQLLLTFGIFMVLEQTANLLFTSRSLKVHLGYVSASATIGSITFGTFEFIYVATVVVLLVGLLLFLKSMETT